METYRGFDIFEKDTSRDIKELLEKQEELKKSLKIYKTAAETTTDIIWEGDLIKHKRYFFGKLYEILGYEANELDELDEWFNIIHPEDVFLVKDAIRKQIENNTEVITFEYRVKCKNGNYKWLFSRRKCEFNEKGETVSVFGAFSDITEIKEQQKRIYDLAYYDTITGLPNRYLLREVIEEKIKIASKNRTKFSMIYLDIDNFKLINDSYGHHVGDKLLLEVGKKLIEIQDDTTSFFRLGGDEFIVLLDCIQNNEEVEKVAKSLHKVLSSTIIIDGILFSITHSDGIVIYPEDGVTFQDLLKNVDTAMYKSKDLGKCTTSFYEAKFGQTTMEKVNILLGLHKAIENNEFKLYYQPIVDTISGKIKGCEALIRWIHPKGVIIPPDKFIGIAEENGAIIKIGKWVFESACRYAKKMYDKGYTDFYISINISPYQLLEKDFTNFILNTIRSVGVLPELVIIEITESVLIKTMDLVIYKLQELKKHNIRIALDDFGCGYSSLTYLKMLPIDIVKIDRTFIADIKSEKDKKNITNIIINLSMQLGLSVIAEGVEYKYQLEYLNKYNCDMAQGYFISKPVPEEEFIKLMKPKDSYPILVC